MLTKKTSIALDVLAHVMGEGETCRLHCRLKEDQNKVFSIGASNWTPAFVRGQFIISVCPFSFTVALGAERHSGRNRGLQENSGKPG